MATTRYPKELLRGEIIAALKTAPCVSLLYTTGGAAGVYTNDVLGEKERLDPGLFPCIVVCMPQAVDSEPLTENISSYTYEADVYVYQSEDTHATADTDMAQILTAMRSSMAAYYSAGMKALGLQQNGITFSDGDWGELGQDQCYRVKARCVSFVAPTATISL